MAFVLARKLIPDAMSLLQLTSAWIHATIFEECIRVAQLSAMLRQIPALFSNRPLSRRSATWITLLRVDGCRPVRINGLNFYGEMY